jgi:hypothetical protein
MKFGCALSVAYEYFFPFTADKLLIPDHHCQTGERGDEPDKCGCCRIASQKSSGPRHRQLVVPKAGRSQGNDASIGGSIIPKAWMFRNSDQRTKSGQSRFTIVYFEWQMVVSCFFDFWQTLKFIVVYP